MNVDTVSPSDKTTVTISLDRMERILADRDAAWQENGRLRDQIAALRAAVALAADYAKELKAAEMEVLRNVRRADVAEKQLRSVL